jgi:hypothetical protein
VTGGEPCTPELLLPKVSVDATLPACAGIDQ